MRRQFQLAEEDVNSLAGRGFNWESIIENNTKWIIIPEYPIPPGYNHRSASAALRISPSYPDDQIDMAYFFPALALASGRGIKALTPHPLDGKQYQQWSRHRKPGEWRPGIDNIGTHLLQVDGWLEKELRG
jgi:hypothetical protein